MFKAFSSKVKLVLLLFFFAFPIIASYMVFYLPKILDNKASNGIKIFGINFLANKTNYGFFIEPQRPIPVNLYVQLINKNYASLQLQPLKKIFPKKWLLISVHNSNCEKTDDASQTCVRKLFYMRQLRIALGAKRSHIQPIWLITDSGPIKSELFAAYTNTYAAGAFMRAHLEILKDWLPTNTGFEIEDYLYLVDSFGNLIMRFPAMADTKKMYRDLKRIVPT